ncbi:hypothetical protein J4443_03920, partial [Candidatus Woesearchaeota archaeon]|nr:hypothetical protein [Candidatus Woesearchaeota archaeon]
MKKGEITTIRVLKETKEKLGNYGKKSETYDDIIKRLLKDSKFFLLFIFFLALFSSSALAVIDMLSLEASLFDSSGDPINGNITIEIYDAETAGNLIYNSTDDFIDNITSGKIDIVLGGSRASNELNLTFGTTYYMDININGNDIDFNGLERQEFQSQVGNVSLSRINISDSIIPDVNITFDLGSLSSYFRTAFIQSLSLLTPLDSGNISDVYLFNTGDTATGDYNFDGSTFFIDSAGNNIGIRTSTPANALNVIGDANITGELTVGGVSITADSNVSGGGTTGYLAKFVNASELGNSIIEEESDKIAIGTGILSPTHLLSVFGSGNFTGDLIVDGLATLGNIAENLINATHIAASAINTTHILDGTIALVDLAFSPLERTDNVAWKNETNTFSADQIIGDTFNNGGIELKTDGTAMVQKLFINSGNTTVIEGQLVNGSSYPVLDSAFEFGNSSNRWTLVYANDLFANGTVELGEAVYVDSTNKRIGIGKPSPDVLLQVQDDSSDNSTISNLLILRKTTTDESNGTSGLGSSIIFQSENSLGNIINLTEISSNLTEATNGSESADLIFSTISAGTLAERVRINDSGYVGIGVANPDVALNVSGSIGATGNITANTFFGDGSQLSGVIDNASLNYVGNESDPGKFIPALGTTEGIMKIDITSLSAEKSLENFTGSDSILTDYIYPNTLSSINLDNITILKDLRVLGSSYLGSLIFDSNGTFPDSILTDFIFPNSASSTSVDNITILKDLRVLGNSYLIGDIFLPTNSLSSCSGKLITSADGNITCGVDASGGGMDYTNIAM